MLERSAGVVKPFQHARQQHARRRTAPGEGLAVDAGERGVGRGVVEATEVDLGPGHLERVAPARAHDLRGRHQLPQARDLHVQRRAGVLWERLPVQLVDQRGRRDRPARVQREQSEQRAQERAARDISTGDLDRAEKTDLRHRPPKA